MNLETTNWLLAVIALASFVQMLAIIAAGIAGYRVYRQTTISIHELESQHIAPLRQKVDAIMGDVHAVTARVSQQTERADHAISTTIDRVDETAERVKHSVRDKVSRAVGIVRGVRAVLVSLLATDSPKPRAEASGRA
jgi:methyl-accepting chemotaxis protein